MLVAGGGLDVAMVTDKEPIVVIMVVVVVARVVMVTDKAAEWS